MELEHKLAQMESEKLQYINLIDNINAEKLALDQMLVDNIKNTLTVKKDIIFLNQKIIKIQNELDNANKENIDLKEKLTRLDITNPFLNEEKN